MSRRPSRGALVAMLAGVLLGCAREQDAQAQGGQDGRGGAVRFVDPQEVMLESLNGDRRAARLPPLGLDPELERVVQAYADELTAAARPLRNPGAQELMDRLEARGYKAFRLVSGFAQAGGDFAGVLRQWRSGDPQTFQRLTAAEVNDFALGVGDIRGQPFYLAVGAVKRAEHYGEIGETLTISADRTRNQILAAINEARADAKAKPLQRSPLLDGAAQAYAEDMLRRGYYGHFSPEGQDVMDRVKASGYRPYKVAENVASGQASAAQVVEGWLDSAAHYHNLSDPDYRETGIGIAAGMGDDGEYHFLWVQIFAEPAFGFKPAKPGS